MRSENLKSIIEKRDRISDEISVLEVNYEECNNKIDIEFVILSNKIDSLIDGRSNISLLEEEKLITIEMSSITVELIDKIEKETNLKLMAIDSVDPITIGVHFKFE